MLCRFASLNVVCDELNDCAWYLSLYQLSDKCVYVYCVESFAHIECYSDCSRRGSYLVEPLQQTDGRCPGTQLSRGERPILK